MPIFNNPIKGIKRAQVSKAPTAEPSISELYDPEATDEIFLGCNCVPNENCIPTIIAISIVIKKKIK